MSLQLTLSRGDIILILAVSLQATVMAYLKQPKWKAIILSLPIPFTFMTLASGRPVDVTTIAGAVLFFFFMQAVRLLHYQVRVPIVPAIIIGALGYCAVGGALAAVLPRTALAYWIVAIGAFIFGTAMFCVLPYKPEPGQRSYLPVWIKFPIITLIIVFLVGSRGLLQGFATVFPIMGTLTCYEARRSLWTMGRQAALVCLLLAVALSASYITEPIIGLAPSLVVSWIAWTAAFVPITRYQWSHVAAALPANNPVAS